MDLGLIRAGGIIEAKVSLPEGNGGAAGTRTPYLFNAIEALSQMSYSPTQVRINSEVAEKAVIAGWISLI